VARAAGPFFFPESAALQIRFDFREQFQSAALQELRVEHSSFRAVEDSVGVTHAVERKLFDQLAGTQKLLVVAGAQPSNARKLRNASGKIPPRDTCLRRWRRAFRKPRLVRAENQGYMRKHGGVAPSAS